MGLPSAQKPRQTVGETLKGQICGQRGVGCIDPPPLCSDLRGYCDLDAIGLGILTQGEPDRQHTGLVPGR